MENNELLNFELLHRHIIGDIEKSTDEKIKEYGKYFFQNEAYRLFKKVDAIHVKTENGQKPVSNSVLAVTGERGSGKTSFLKTIEKELNKQKGYYTFPVIDPSSLHGDLNILEIVCTHIDIIIEEKRQKGHYVDTTLAEYRKIKNDLSKIILAADTDHKQSDNGLQRLDENRKKVQFDENFTKLLMGFLQLINHDQINEKKEKCILLIDDLDLVEDKVIYELTEHIRKYFNGQMIVILTYKEDQLNDVLLKDKIIKEKDLKDHTDREKLNDQCQKYTEKLIPYEHRVRLKNHKDFYGMNMKEFFDEMIKPIVNKKATEEEYLSDFFPENIVDKKEDTLKQWFEKMTFYKSKVNIKAVDKLEQVDTAFANNLRGIVQWIETVYSMETLNQEKIDVGDNDEWKKLKQNVELVRIRVILTTFDLLSEEQRQFLKMWLNTLVEAKLYQIYYYLGDNVVNKMESNQYLVDMVDHRLIKPNNVSLADVIKMINIYKLLYPKEGLFIYIFKVLYSCELIEKYMGTYILNDEKLEKIDNNESDNNESDNNESDNNESDNNELVTRQNEINFDNTTNDYLELLRRDVMPSTKPIFSTNVQGGSTLNKFEIQKFLSSKNKQALEEVIISTYSTSGDIFSLIRPPYNNVDIKSPTKISAHFWNDFFSTENQIIFNGKYLWHPFTIISTNSYLSLPLKYKKYVLISLFDLDYFLEKSRYHNGSRGIENLISVLNIELSGRINKKREPQYNYLNTRLFSENQDTAYKFIKDEIVNLLREYLEYLEDLNSDSEKRIINISFKKKKDSLINGLKLLKNEFADDSVILKQIEELLSELEAKSYIKSFDTRLVHKIQNLFKKSVKYNFVFGKTNEK